MGIIAMNPIAYVMKCEREEEQRRLEAEEERILEREALEEEWYRLDMELKEEQIRQEKLKTKLLEQQLKSLESSRK